MVTAASRRRGGRAVKKGLSLKQRGFPDLLVRYMFNVVDKEGSLTTTTIAEIK